MASILKPELLWIEGRCYRVNDPSTEVSALQEHDLYENDVNYNDEEADEEDDFEVTMVDNSRYATSFHVSKHYIGYIIGRKGATKMRIEKETNTMIKIPKHGEAGGITILGSTAANVKTARRRINIIVVSSRAKQKPTHFISIPMNVPNVMKNFEDFKDQVLKDTSSRGIEESIFMRTKRLHLTIGVMCLMDNEERLTASKIFGEAKAKIIMPLLREHSPLKIRVKGLSYMNDDPKQIDVLYARAYDENEETCVLQTLADQLMDHFYKAGFMKKEFDRDNVKLHVTLMNTRYRAASDDVRKKRESFDGSEVLERFTDFDFGVLELNELHLSQRNSAGDDGYYQPTCIISCRQ